MGFKVTVEDVWVIQKENKNGEVLGVVFSQEEVAAKTNRLSRTHGSLFWVKHYQHLEKFGGLNCIDSYSVGMADSTELSPAAVAQRQQAPDHDVNMNAVAERMING